MISKLCGTCGKAFMAPVFNKKYCSPECKGLSRRRNDYEMRKCGRPSCGKMFLGKPRNKVYCSNLCFYAVQRQRCGAEPSEIRLSTATVGAMAELKVCVDLLAKGYEVFRAVSPSCSCDLALLSAGKLARIEVRTGYRNPRTGHTWASFGGTFRADIFAVVHRDGIEYQPKKGWIKCHKEWKALWSSRNISPESKQV